MVRKKGSLSSEIRSLFILRIKNMKTIHASIATVFLSTAVFAGPVQEAVLVQLGPKAFQDGDVIQIEEVRSTSAHLEQGDTVTVRGQYRLDSRKAANLRLHVTQVEGDGVEETDAKQIFPATQGFKPFELTTTVKHKGYLHLTFYDTESSKPFGGTYFGTAQQMRQASKVSVSHYLR